MSSLPRPDLPPGPQRDLVEALHELHHRAGWPSLRRLAADAGCSHTTVSKCFSSTALPPWGTLELLVEAMAGDTGHFHELWLAASSPTPRGTASSSQVAGRKAELAAVRHHLETGSGLLLVLGEAGMGKTRLVTTASKGTAADVVVATGHCLPLSTEVSLLPLVDILQDVHERDAGQWVEQALADCPDHVQALIGRLLPQVATAQVQLPSDSRQLLLSAIGTTMKSLRSQRPLALLIEDLHWADPTTRDLLEHMAARGPDVPLLGTWRTEESTTSTAAGEWLTRVRRLPTVTVLELEPLTREETAEQLALLHGHEPTADEITTIHERSLGLPLFTEQLAAHARRTRELPSLLENLLAQRLTGLSEQAWLVAGALGVADRPLSAAILAGATRLTPSEQTRALHELDDRRLLTSGAAAEAQLRHPLLAEAVRQRLVTGEKSAWHSRLAAALSDVGTADPAEIALHWREAGEPARELEVQVRAARHAHERLNPAQEAEHWLRVVELWPAEDAAYEFEGCADRDEALSNALDALDDSDDWSRALALVDARLGELDGVVTDSSARLHGLAAGFHAMHEDRTVALELAGQAVELRRQLLSGPGLARSLAGYGFLLSLNGRRQEGLSFAREALVVAQAVDDRAVIFDSTVTVAALEAATGDLDGALTRIETLRAEGPAPSWQLEMWLGMIHTDVLLVHCRPLADVQEAGLPALELTRTPSLAGTGAIVKDNIAEAMLRAGQVSRAASMIDPPDGAGTTLSDFVLGTWARIEVCRGRLADARRTVAALDAATTSMPQLTALRAEAGAQLELWSDRPRHAFERLWTALEELLHTDETEYLGPGYALVARAAADDSRGDRAIETRTLLEDLRRRATQDPFSGVCGDNAAWAACWDSEIARLTGAETVDVWVRAAAEWDRITRPHDAAYCRWRAAQVALRDDQGTLATKLLRRAARDAREHVPLNRAIVATMAGAH